MPVTGQTKNQVRYNRRRTRAAKYLYKRIQEDYIKLRVKHIDKSVIISMLQNKYRNRDGYPYSHQTIYNALNFREINRRIREMQACNPLLDAKAGQVGLQRPNLAIFHDAPTVSASRDKRINQVGKNLK